jgi:hypothetical protein
MNHAKFRVSQVCRDLKLNLRRDQPIQRVLFYCGIGIDREDVLVECRVDTNDILDLMVHFQLQWVHRRVKVDLVIRFSTARQSPRMMDIPCSKSA